MALDGFKNWYNNNGGMGGLTNDLSQTIGVFLENKRTTPYSAFSGDLQRQLAEIGNPTSTQDIADMFANYDGIQGPSYRDVRGSSSGERILGTVSAAANGMMSGLSHGNWLEGAIKAGVNTIAGVTGGIIGNRKARRTYADLQDMSTRLNTQGNYMANNALNNFNNNKGLNALRTLANGGFTNGVRTFETGGSHEMNPYGGVQVGVEPDGTRDLVEQGETEVNLGMSEDGSNNTYVFSNNEMPVDLCRKYKLPKGTTFSEASQKLQKESEERPNDPISRNGLKAKMNNLMADQEQYNYEQEMKQLNAMLNNMSDEDKIAMLQAMTQGIQEQPSPEEQAMTEQQMMQQGYLQEQMQPEMAEQQMMPQDQMMQPMEQQMPMQAMRCGGKVKRADKGELFVKGYQPIDLNNLMNGRTTLLPVSSNNPMPTGNTMPVLNYRPGMSLQNTVYSPQAKSLFELGNERINNDLANRQLNFKGLINNHFNESLPNGYALPSKDNPLQLPDYIKNRQQPVIKGDEEESEDQYSLSRSPLRYAPAMMGAYSYLRSLAQKPDYSRANALIDIANRMPRASYTPTGTMMAYTPTDMRTQFNDMNNVNSRRLAMLRSMPNRQAAIAGIIGNNAHYANAMSQMQNAYDDSRRKAMSDTIHANNALAAANAQGFANAQQLNLQRANQQAAYYDRAYNMMDAIDASLGASRSNNMSNLTSNLQNIGFEDDRYNRIKTEGLAGNFGVLNEYMKALYDLYNKNRG